MLVKCYTLIPNNVVSNSMESYLEVHMVNGVWGLIAVGLCAAPGRLQEVYGRSEHVGLLYSFSHKGVDGTLLATQMIGIMFIMGWVSAIMLPFFVWLDWKGWFRSDALEELVGLDVSYHGGCLLRSEVQPEYITDSQENDEARVRKQYASSISSAETISDTEGKRMRV
jgi:ammonia channel protein AmtB